MTNLGLPKRFRWLFLLTALAFIMPLSIASGRSPSLQIPHLVSVDSPTFSRYAGTGFFTASLDAPAPSDTTLSYSVTNGTAVSGVDFQMPLSGTATIPAGQISVLIPFTIIVNANVGSYSFTINVLLGTDSLVGTATITDAPSNLTAKANSFTEIYLTWMNNNPNIDFNQFERSPDGLTNWQVIGDVNPTDTYVTNIELTCGTYYYYRLRGVFSTGPTYTDYSNTAGARTDTCSPLNAAPQQNYFTISSPTLTWNRVSGAVTYDLQIGNNMAFTGAPPLVTGITGLSYAPPALDNGVYYWRVRAVVAGKPGLWTAAQIFVVDVPET